MQAGSPKRFRFQVPWPGSRRTPQRTAAEPRHRPRRCSRAAGAVAGHDGIALVTHTGDTATPVPSIQPPTGRITAGERVLLRVEVRFPASDPCHRDRSATRPSRSGWRPPAPSSAMVTWVRTGTGRRSRAGAVLAEADQPSPVPALRWSPGCTPVGRAATPAAPGGRWRRRFVGHDDRARAASLGVVGNLKSGIGDARGHHAGRVPADRRPLDTRWAHYGVRIAVSRAPDDDGPSGSSATTAATIWVANALDCEQFTSRVSASSAASAPLLRPGTIGMRAPIRLLHALDRHGCACSSSAAPRRTMSWRHGGGGQVEPASSCSTPACRQASGPGTAARAT